MVSNLKKVENRVSEKNFYEFLTQQKSVSPPKGGVGLPYPFPQSQYGVL